MSIKVCVSRQKYQLKDGTIKYGIQRCKYKVSGTKSSGRPKKDLSQYDFNEILIFRENNTMTDTYNEFNISRHLFKRLKELNN